MAFTARRSHQYMADIVNATPLSVLGGGEMGGWVDVPRAGVVEIVGRGRDVLAGWWGRLGLLI